MGRSTGENKLDSLGQPNREHACLRKAIASLRCCHGRREKLVGRSERMEPQITSRCSPSECDPTKQRKRMNGSHFLEQALKIAEKRMSLSVCVL